MLQRHNLLKIRGFTLIEVLATVAIIAILTAIAVKGFGALQKTANIKKTKVLLGNASSMLAEYDVETTFKQQPTYMWNAAKSKVTANFNIWRDAVPPSPPVVPPAAPAFEEPLKAPHGSMDSDSATATGERLDGQVVRNTAVVMREISRMPGVKKMLSQSPGELLNIPNEGNSNVMLDSWGNPIIYVPASGLSNIYLGDKADTDADKPFVIGNNRTVLQSALGATPLVLPGARPFFASAGPDGIFDYVDVNGNNSFDAGIDIPCGNDNIYSFEN